MKRTREKGSGRPSANFKACQIVLLVVATACSSGEVGEAATTTSRFVPSSTTVAPTIPTTQPVLVPPPVEIPSAAVIEAYRQPIGRFADLVLGDAATPIGSAEHLMYMQSCFAAMGFHVDIDIADGRVDANIPDGQADAYFAASDDCTAAAVEAGLIPEVFNLTREALTAYYEAALWTYRCLVAAGYTPKDPPSLEAFIDGETWNIYEGLDIRLLGELNERCPQDALVVFAIIAAEE